MRSYFYGLGWRCGFFGGSNWDSVPIEMSQLDRQQFEKGRARGRSSFDVLMFAIAVVGIVAGWVLIAWLEGAITW